MNMRFHRGIPDAPKDEPRASSSVHVLNDEHDLRAALERAAAYDRQAAEALRSRSARYRALLGEPTLGEPPAPDDADPPLSRPA